MGGKRSTKVAFNLCTDLKDLGLYPHVAAGEPKGIVPGAAV